LLDSSGSAVVMTRGDTGVPELPAAVLSAKLIPARCMRTASSLPMLLRSLAGENSASLSPSKSSWCVLKPVRTGELSLLNEWWRMDDDAAEAPATGAVAPAIAASRCLCLNCISRMVIRLAPPPPVATRSARRRATASWTLKFMGELSRLELLLAAADADVELVMLDRLDECMNVCNGGWTPLPLSDDDAFSDGLEYDDAEETSRRPKGLTAPGVEEFARLFVVSRGGSSALLLVGRSAGTAS